MAARGQAGRGTASDRAPLTRERVVQAAVDIADEDGLAALTMRSLAQALDVRPMSLYHHVAHKEAVLDDIVDAVFAEIDLPLVGGEWRAAMLQHGRSTRAAMNRHPWALALMESRTRPGPATLRHHDAMLACLRSAGFSLSMTAHAFAVIDAFVYGFALQEASLPVDAPEEVAPLAQDILKGFGTGDYPHLAEFTTDHILQPGYSFGASFDFGLELLLDGLARVKDVGRNVNPG